MRRSLGVLSCLLCLTFQLSAQIPLTISYQGILCDAAGKPKPDNFYSMTFRLYDAASGGAAIWTSEQTVVTDRGLFTATLGSAPTVFGPAVTFDKPYWLSIQVGNEAELSPRVPLSSTGYSINCINADTADYAAQVKDGSVTSGKIPSGQVVKSISGLKDNVTLAAGSNVSITPSGNTLTISASGGGGGTLTGSASSGQVTFWTGSTSIGGNGGLFWDNSLQRLGIGTTSPSYPVHIRSTADWVTVGEATASTGDVWGGVFFAPNSSTGRGVYGSGNYLGVYGRAPATSGTNYGVYGISSSSSGTGVRGYAESITGSTRGVFGESLSSDGVGVYGLSNGGGTAVYAESKGIGPALQTTGSVLFSGTTEATPASGPGTRLMWIPGKGAFRAGYAGGTEWDNANIGRNSIAMGVFATASGFYCTAIGSSITASGTFSTAMGYRTTASGENSTAMGNWVSTNSHSGSFIIGDAGTGVYTNSGSDNEFMAVFAGGYMLYTTRSANQGVYMKPNTSGWVNISDRNKKENFRPLDGEQLLSKIRSMSITEWNYKGTDPSIKYIGPVAQDFHAAFHLAGTDSLGINSICIDGVNMAAVQALERRTSELREKTAELQARTLELETVKSRLAELEAKFVRLEQAVSMSKDITQHVVDENQR